MRVSKCDNKSDFNAEVLSLLKADSIEWKGFKVTFGSDAIDLKNIGKFLENNKDFLKDNENSNTRPVESLKARIRQEFDPDKIREVEEVAEFLSLTHPSHLAKFAHKPSSEVIRYLKKTAQTYKTWDLKTRREWINWINENETRIGAALGFKTEEGAVAFVQECRLDLEHLDLTDIPNLRSENIEKMIDSCPNLKTIIFFQTKISDQVIKKLSQLKSCKQIVFHHCEDLFITELPENLEVLKIVGNDAVILINLPLNLRELSLIYVKVRELPNLPSSLQKLELLACTKLKQLPDLPQGLQLLNIAQCKDLMFLLQDAKFQEEYLLKILPENLKTFIVYLMLNEELNVALGKLRMTRIKTKIMDSLS